MISVPPLVCTNKTCLWYVFTLMNCRCFYSSTDVSGTDPLLIELLIAPDYVPYLTSFAVSHGCEILHGEFQRCFIRDSMWRVGFEKNDFHISREGFQKQAAAVAVVPDPFTVIITRITWITWVLVWAELRRETLPWDKMRRVTTQLTQRPFKIWPGDYFTRCFNRGR